MLRLRAFHLVGLVVLLAIILVQTSPAVACKDRNYPETFPIEELGRYSVAVVVKVTKVEPLSPGGRYAPAFRMTATVVKPLKGRLKKGAAIEGVTEQDVEAHARCPIALKEGVTYLLFLNGKDKSYIVPRYGSLYLDDQHPRFKGYVEAIEKQRASRPNRP